MYKVRVVGYSDTDMSDMSINSEESYEVVNDGGLPDAEKSDPAGSIDLSGEGQARPFEAKATPPAGRSFEAKAIPPGTVPLAREGEFVPLFDAKGHLHDWYTYITDCSREAREEARVARNAPPKRTLSDIEERRARHLRRAQQKQQLQESEDKELARRRAYDESALQKRKG